MATESFLINPPKKMRRVSRRRRRNPIGETLVTIGANPMRRRKRNSENPWFGDPEGHRIAALMRWGKVRRGRVSRHRKRHRKVGRPRIHRVAKRRVARKHVTHRRVIKHTKGRWFRKGGAVAYRRKVARQAFLVSKFGHMLAHPRSKRVWTRKGFVTMRRRKRNTWFGQPRRHRKAAKKGWRRGHRIGSRRIRHYNPRRRYRRNPAVVASNPRRRRRSHRARRHSYRRNPALSLGGFTSQLTNVRGWAPLAITGALSAITGQVVPTMVGLSGNPWSKIGVQLVVAIGGGMAVEKFVDARHGQAWMIVGVSMVGFQLLKEFVLIPYAPQFAVGLGDYMNYDVYNPDNEVSQEVGAFPQAMSAFPNAMSDYPGVGGYPYDGSSGY